MRNALVVAAAIVVGSIIIAGGIKSASMNHRYGLNYDGTKIVDQRTGDVYTPVMLGEDGKPSLEGPNNGRVFNTNYAWHLLIKNPPSK